MVTFGNAARPRLRTRVSPRARGRRDGRLNDGRAAWDRRAGADDLGELDTEQDALQDVSGSAPDAFGAAARGSAEEKEQTRANIPRVVPNDASSSIASYDAERSVTLGEADISQTRFPRSVDELRERWRVLPSRYRVVLGTTCAFVLCNMDKVNISVAIIPMAKEMGWSVGQAGLLQSAFFYGFAL